MKYSHKKNVSVIRRIVFIFSCICIFPMVIFIAYLYSMTSNEILTNVRSSLNQSLVKTRNVVEQRMKTIEASCDELVGDNILTQFLDSQYTQTASEIINFNRSVYPFFSLRKKLLPEVYSIWIYFSNTTLPLSWKAEAGMAHMEYCEINLDDKPENLDYWWEPFQDNYVPFSVREEEAPEELFSFNRIIRSPQNGIPIGVVNYQIEIESLFQAVSDVENNTSGTLYVINEDGRIVFSAQRDALNKTLSELFNDRSDIFQLISPGVYNGENDSYIVGSEYIPALKASIVSVQSLSDIRDELKMYTTRMIITLIAACAFMILLVSFASFSIMKRLRKLGMAMKLVEEGDYSISVDPGKNDEFGQLITAFNGMIAKINELINNVYRAQIREKEAQLRALEAQINPHFLYNTLTSIAAVAKSNGDMDSYRMALSLGKFYRLGISKKTELITVSDELEYLKMYLTIQNIRFKNRVNYLFEIEEQYLDCKLIRNLLQPLVENSISHGLMDSKEGGTITVRLTGDEQNLLFEVRDNGIGMDSGVLKRLNEGNFDYDAKSGYGLKNVNDRLQLYYGTEYRLSAISRRNEGTSIFVRVPIRR